MREREVGGGGGGCGGVSSLPAVGDLLLSMSVDCWLSESSVRPAAAKRRKK